MYCISATLYPNFWILAVSLLNKLSKPSANQPTVDNVKILHSELRICVNFHGNAPILQCTFVDTWFILQFFLFQCTAVTLPLFSYWQQAHWYKMPWRVAAWRELGTLEFAQSKKFGSDWIEKQFSELPHIHLSQKQCNKVTK